MNQRVGEDRKGKSGRGFTPENSEERYSVQIIGIRIIVFKHIKHNGKIEYWHLLTNLPDILYSLQVVFDLYYERQVVEAYLKSDKSGLHLKNLRPETS